jgi:hypothetical protein
MPNILKVIAFAFLSVVSAKTYLRGGQTLKDIGFVITPGDGKHKADGVASKLSALGVTAAKLKCLAKGERPFYSRPTDEWAVCLPSPFNPNQCYTYRVGAINDARCRDDKGCIAVADYNFPPDDSNLEIISYENRHGDPCIGPVLPCDQPEQVCVIDRNTRDVSCSAAQGLKGANGDRTEV